MDLEWGLLQTHLLSCPLCMSPLFFVFSSAVLMLSRFPETHVALVVINRNPLICRWKRLDLSQHSVPVI